MERSRKDSRRAIIPRFRSEQCRNPWNGRCENTDIALYIFYEGRKLPICRLCWNEIAGRDLEWGDGVGL